MAEILTPRTAKDVSDVILWAAAEKTPLELVGGETKRGLGQPPSGTDERHVLDLSAVAGITLYQPEELVVTVRPGTLLSELQGTLAEHNQHLGFEPPDLGPLYGLPRDMGTIGGVVGCNLSGPRRGQTGAARDHVLGISGVSGRGDAFKCGGRVVKNVTGYDLCKLLTGSYGTLAALTEVTLKVVPAPEQVTTVVVRGLDDPTAITAMAAVLNSTAEVSAASHIPGDLASTLTREEGPAARSVTGLRLEGPEPSVGSRLNLLRRMEIFRGADIEIYEDVRSREFWAGVRDVAPFVVPSGRVQKHRDQEDRVLWRLSVAPADGARVTAAISARMDARWYYDWAGGLIWVSVRGAERDGGCAAIRDGVAAQGGQATLMRAPDGLRARVPVFPPQELPIARISKQVKQAFDPLDILNPGRMTFGV